MGKIRGPVLREKGAVRARHPLRETHVNTLGPISAKRTYGSGARRTAKIDKIERSNSKGLQETFQLSPGQTVDTPSVQRLLSPIMQPKTAKRYYGSTLEIGHL